MSHLPAAPRTDSSPDPRSIIDRLVILHATSPEREAAARLLGRLVESSGAVGAAYGWTDHLAPDRIVPVAAVAVAPVPHWELDAPRTFAVLVEERDGLRWHLVLRDVDDAGLERASRLIARATKWFRGVGVPDGPSVPDQAAQDHLGRFVALLDAYRLVGFETGAAAHARFLQGELARSLRGLDERVAEQAHVVTEAFEDFDRLPAALLDLGNVLERDGLLSSAAATYVIAYELMLLRADSTAAIDAARFAGRAYRKLTAWEPAVRWYGLGRRIAEHEGHQVQLARVLDGLGNTYRDRGAYPKARELYRRAWGVAQVAGDPVEIGNVALGLMNAERKAGRLDAAAELGWEAIRIQTKPRERVNLLIDIGTLLLEGGDIDAAEHAYRSAQLSAAADPDMGLLAQDALAYCSALRGDRTLYEKMRPRAPRAAPPVRVQIGYFRGAALKALGDTRSDRVLAAVERYARAHGLAEWEVKASQRTAAPLPPSVRTISTPDEVRQGLWELSASLG